MAGFRFVATRAQREQLNPVDTVPALVTMSVMAGREYMRVEQALAAGSDLAGRQAQVALPMVVAGLSPRARIALVFTTAGAGLLLALIPLLWTGPAAPWVVSTVVLVAGLVLFSGLRASGMYRYWTVRRAIRGAHAHIDIVGFAQVTSMSCTRHAMGYVVNSLRLHDHPGTAVSSELAAESAPAWWSAPRRQRAVFFDGFAVRRDAAHQPCGVLLEAAVDVTLSTLVDSVPAGAPVRLLGSESAAILVCQDRVLLPRGRWLPGG